jgi:hypothetical protein
LQSCNSRESAAAERGGMSPPHNSVRIGRTLHGIRLVRELPLALEPVSRDPFIDDGRRRPAVHTSQRDLVRESLLRCPGEERV